jgi:hypothetical protein
MDTDVSGMGRANHATSTMIRSLAYLMAILALGTLAPARADIIYVTNYAASTVSRITSDGVVSTFVPNGKRA